MTPDELAKAEALRDMVTRVMTAVSTAPGTAEGGTAVDAQHIVAAFQFITAAMLEASPGTKTPKALREAADAQAAQILGLAKRFRADFERTGAHPWDMLNVPPERMN